MENRGVSHEADGQRPEGWSRIAEAAGRIAGRALGWFLDSLESSGSQLAYTRSRGIVAPRQPAAAPAEPVVPPEATEFDAGILAAMRSTSFSPDDLMAMLDRQDGPAPPAREA